MYTGLFFGSILKVSGIEPLCFLATNYHHLPQKLPHLYKFWVKKIYMSDRYIYVNSPSYSPRLYKISRSATVYIYMCLYMLLNSIVKLMMIVLAGLLLPHWNNKQLPTCVPQFSIHFQRPWRRVNKGSIGVMGLVLVLAPYQIRCITAAPMHMLESILSLSQTI
jgi:hypothetical protein